MSERSIRLCSGAGCGLRFPGPTDDARLDECPLCGAATSIVRSVAEPVRAPAGRSGRTIVGVLDNLRSAQNVGTIVRTADGAGLRHLHLCGFTPTPENPKVAKTSLGSQDSIAWTHHFNAIECATALQVEGYELWALEASAASVAVLDLEPSAADAPIALVVGNEVDGVDADLLTMADRVVHLPMQGEKSSLNVGVAFGIAAYHLTFVA